MTSQYLKPKAAITLFRPRHFEWIRSRRLAAFIVDLLIATIMGMALNILVYIISDLKPEVFLNAAKLVKLTYLFWVLLFLVSIGHPKAATPGMRLLNIQVATLRGDRPLLGRKFIHLVVLMLYAVYIFPVIYVLAVAPSRVEPIFLLFLAPFGLTFLSSKSCLPQDYISGLVFFRTDIE